MLKASQLYRKGGYNVCVCKVDCQTGEATITLFKHGWKRGYAFRVKNFGEENEMIIEDKELPREEKI